MAATPRLHAVATLHLLAATKPLQHVVVELSIRAAVIVISVIVISVIADMHKPIAVHQFVHRFARLYVRQFTSQAADAALLTAAADNALVITACSTAVVMPRALAAHQLATAAVRLLPAVAVACSRFSVRSSHEALSANRLKIKKHTAAPCKRDRRFSFRRMAMSKAHRPIK